MIECMVLSVYIVRCGPLGCTPAIYIELENHVGKRAMTKTGFQRATGATNKHRQVKSRPAIHYLILSNLQNQLRLQSAAYDAPGRLPVVKFAPAMRSVCNSTHRIRLKHSSTKVRYGSLNYYDRTNTSE